MREYLTTKLFNKAECGEDKQNEWNTFYLLFYVRQEIRYVNIIEGYKYFTCSRDVIFIRN